MLLDEDCWNDSIEKKTCRKSSQDRCVEIGTGWSTRREKEFWYRHTHNDKPTKHSDVDKMRRFYRKLSNRQRIVVVMICENCSLGSEQFRWQIPHTTSTFKSNCRTFFLSLSLSVALNQTCTIVLFDWEFHTWHSESMITWFGDCENSVCNVWYCAIFNVENRVYFE